MQNKSTEDLVKEFLSKPDNKVTICKNRAIKSVKKKKNTYITEYKSR